MRTGPLVDALIEHLVGGLCGYALETAFTSSWGALSWHELTQLHGRAAGGSWVTGGATRSGHQGRGLGRSRRGPQWLCDDPVPPFRQVSRTTDRAGLALRARDDGDATTEREVRSLHGESGSPAP
jgi:hypothetical protein